MRLSDLRDVLIMRQPRKGAAQQLRGRLWIEQLMHRHDLTLADVEFAAIPSVRDSGQSTGVAYRWAKGDRVPTRNTVRRTESILHDTEWIYELPIYEYLDFKALGKNAIFNSVAHFFGFEAWSEWALSGREKNSFYHPLSLFEVGASAHLASTGSLSAFVVVLAMVRSADSDNDIDSFLDRMGNALRMYPLISRTPWIYPHRDLLRECMKQLNDRCPSMNVFLIPNWTQLEELIHEPEIRIQRDGLLEARSVDGVIHSDINPIIQFPHDYLRD